MKFFCYNEEVDQIVKSIMARVRALMDGEVAARVKLHGGSYRDVHGVSLVHLRGLSKEIAPSNDVAERLWYMQARETMILATMVANRDDLRPRIITPWAAMVTNVELAEQAAFNMLGKSDQAPDIIGAWLDSGSRFAIYAALMSIGWQYRFVGKNISGLLSSRYPGLEALAHDYLMARAVAHCLKMAARYDSSLENRITKLAAQWVSHDNMSLRRAGEEILMESSYNNPGD